MSRASAGPGSAWPAVRTRYLFREVNDRGYDLPLASVTKQGGVEFRHDLGMSVWNPAEDTSQYKRVCPGDFVIGLRSFQSGIGYSQLEGLVSPAYTVFRPVHPSVSVAYFRHLLKSGWLVSLLENVSQGIRQGRTIAIEDFYQLRVPVPPLMEQQAIADFLDTETTRIDALIIKKRRLVELALERMEGRVREVTRRGIDPRVQQRDSGLPWVGQIPSHWRLVPLRSLLASRRDLVGYAHDDVVLLSLTRRGVIVRDVSDNHGKFPASFDTYQHVSPGEIVFCLFDIPETPRTVGLVRHAGMVTGAYSVFRVQGASAPFLTYLYQGFDDEKSLSLWYTGLRNVIRPATFLSMRCPLPPDAEQDAIVAVLDRECSLVADLVSRLQRQTALLREHRAALITAAVTGELEVPGVAA